MLKRRSKGLFFGVGLIFIGSMFSAWMYGRLGFLPQADISLEEGRGVSQCLYGSLDVCDAAEVVKEKIRFQVVSMDKLALLLVVFFVSCSLCGFPCNGGGKSFWVTSIVMFAYLVGVQYFTFYFKYMVWDFIQDSWKDPIVVAARDGCFSSGYRADCTELRIFLKKIQTLVLLLEGGRFLIFLGISIVMGMLLWGNLDGNKGDKMEIIE